MKNLQTLLLCGVCFVFSGCVNISAVDIGDTFPSFQRVGLLVDKTPVSLSDSDFLGTNTLYIALPMTCRDSCIENIKSIANAREDMNNNNITPLIIMPAEEGALHTLLDQLVDEDLGLLFIADAEKSLHKRIIGNKNEEMWGMVLAGVDNRVVMSIKSVILPPMEQFLSDINPE